MRHKIMRSSSLLVVLGLVLFAALVSRSGINFLDMPKVGGGVHGETYELNLEFENALNLPERAFVKLNGVDVGYVTRIETADYQALVRIGVRKKVELPRGTTAELRQVSPLGDVFVALTLPKKGGPLLRDGDTIPIAGTSAAPQIEDMLAAASLLINGGAVADLGTITQEMNAFLGGNEAHVGSLIRQIGGTVALLNRRSKDIDATLSQLDAVSRIFNRQRATLKAGITDFTPAIKLVADERRDIVALVSKFGRIGVDVEEIVRKSGADLVASLRSVQDVLLGFSEIGEDLGPVLHDMVLLGEYAEHASRGENLAGTAHFGLSRTTIPSILELLGLQQPRQEVSAP
jgi:phospholipid/cholesterol/gamma-HCH transport system substrate-binding protein